MPRLMRFSNCEIAMFFADHPPPHFHAVYGEHEAQIDLRTLAVLEGANSAAGTRAGRAALGYYRRRYGQYKSDPALGRIPVLAITGYTSSEDERRIRSAGARGYLPKPVRHRDFSRAVDQLLAAPAEAC